MKLLVFLYLAVLCDTSRPIGLVHHMNCWFLATMAATSLNQAVMPTGISETSRAAAKKAKPKFAGKVKTVYEAISRAERLGLTDEEAQELLVMSGNSYRPARRALVKLGLVDKSGEHRLTRAGNNANIWVVIAKPADVGV